MKNSAETNADSRIPEPEESGSSKLGSGKTSFKLFSINEHRLSLGLLILVLVSAAGYGIWMAMSPFLPQSAATAVSNATRKEIAESFFEAEQWNDATEIYSQMLEDDPDNGFARQKLAMAQGSLVSQKWQELKDIGRTTGNSNAADKILEEESKCFALAVKHWNLLLDNPRYDQRAYVNLASLHSQRSKYLDAPEEADTAIAVLDRMFQSGYATSMGIRTMGPFRPLRNHPEFKRLEQDENKNRKPDLDSLFFLRGIRGFR